MEFGPIGPVITPNGCIRFIHPEHIYVSCYYNYDGGTYTMKPYKNNADEETISFEYDMDTLKQIPNHKNDVKDGIMTLKYREYGFELNLKFKVDPLMYMPQLSKNKNDVILQTKHINNIENITTFNIYMYDFQGVMLHNLIETDLDNSDYYYFESYSIAVARKPIVLPQNNIIIDYEQLIYIWNHITNKMINIFVSNYVEITHIGYDKHYDLFIILDDDDDSNLTILYINKLNPSEYLLRVLPNLHNICDKYIKTNLLYRFVKVTGYKYKLLWYIGETLNNKQIVIIDPVKLIIIKEIEFIGYCNLYDIQQIGDKIIYELKSEDNNEKIYMVTDLIKCTNKPIKDYIPEDQLLNISPNSINPVGLNKCWLRYNWDYKLVDFNH